MKIIIIVTIYLLSPFLHAQDSLAVESHLVCAAANGILVTRMEPGVMADLITSVGLRHANSARNAGAAESDIRQFIEALGFAYNEGEITWEEIADIAEGCSQI